MTAIIIIGMLLSFLVPLALKVVLVGAAVTAASSLGQPKVVVVTDLREAQYAASLPRIGARDPR